MESFGFVLPNGVAAAPAIQKKLENNPMQSRHSRPSILACSYALREAILAFSVVGAYEVAPRPPPVFVDEFDAGQFKSLP